MAIIVEQGSIKPTLITSLIIIVLVVWSLYAFSAAGMIVKLLFLRVVLVMVTADYLLRGLAGYIFINNALGRTPEFWIWSSSICLGIGILHLIGLKQVWLTL